MELANYVEVPLTVNEGFMLVADGLDTAVMLVFEREITPDPIDGPEPSI